MKHYAQCSTSTGICFALVSTAGTLVAPQGVFFVEVADNDASYLGRVYSNGAWQ